MSLSSTSTASVSAPANRLATLPGGEPPLTLGHAAAQWAHENLIQPNGPRAGQPFRLTFDQFRFLLHWYAVDEEGQWIYSHGVRRLAKGSGKSPFAAVLALIEFCGPCRLERFDDRLPGGCKVKPVDMPLVQIAATAESQTANTMRMVRAFAPRKSAFVDKYNLDPGKTQYYKVPEGTLEVITSSATAAEGAEASFIIGDETEHWKPSNGGPDLAATLEDNLAKSGSRMLETSNAWIPGQETVAEASWEAWLAQEEGRQKAEGGLILYDARIAAPDTDMGDYGSLEAALRFVYEDCEWKRGPDGEIDVRPIIKRIWNPKSQVDNSKRKYLNWPTAADDAWTTPEEWSALADPQSIEQGEWIVAFFDGSKSKDATALVGCRVSDGHVFLIDAWERPALVEDWQVPVDEVDGRVDWMFDHYKVAAFFADVREWESFAHTLWPNRHKDDIVLWAQKSGRNAGPIAWDMRSHTMDFTLAAEACLTDIEDQNFTHDGNPVLHRHVVNARRRLNRWGVSIGKESPDSRKKIDAAVCAIGARMVRRLLLASDEWANHAEKSKPGRVVGW